MYEGVPSYYDETHPAVKGPPMAQKVQVTLVDDLDGKKADETVTFALDGSTYVIDLSKAHAEKLRSTLQPYIEAGRKDKSARPTGRGASRKATAPSTVNTAEVREWAKASGIEASGRGRLPTDLIAKFQAAHA